MITAFRNLVRAPNRSHNNAKFLVVNARYKRSSPTQTSASAEKPRGDKNKKDNSSVFVPLNVEHKPDSLNVGVELAGDLTKAEILPIVLKFLQMPECKLLASEVGMDAAVFKQAALSFKQYCLMCKPLPAELHIILADIKQGAGHVSDIFPYFVNHTKEMYPHLECIDDLKQISDLRNPANWYPDARSTNRKIYFHAGPTNSGKTYHALQTLMKAETGLYCGPLKMLAVEIYQKMNEAGVPCDLVTGEDRKYAISESQPANHVSCTIEMTNLKQPYDVAVIDEIQMLQNPQRGHAWTRALLGVNAKEIHLCGEEAAVHLVEDLVNTTNESLEVRKYERLTKLTIEDKALQSLSNIRDGDCVVCFNKKDIYAVSNEIEKRSGRSVAVIYGDLPPGTKLAQAKKFNDPKDPCNVLVATDAIGMGLNLSIRRMIFYSLTKINVNEKGVKEIDFVSTSQALQIAGRAGRFQTQYEEGFITTFRSTDLEKLKEILSRDTEKIGKAGLHPMTEQIEMYSYHLPKSSFSNIIDIFIQCASMSDLYFICDTEQMKFQANLIQHVPLPLRARYVFSIAPLQISKPLLCTMFVKYARKFSENDPLTLQWLCKNINWPIPPAISISELTHLEQIFDALDLYLWLGTRFRDVFLDLEEVRKIQMEIDNMIESGVSRLSKMLRKRFSVQQYKILTGSSHNEPVSTVEDAAEDVDEDGNGDVEVRTEDVSTEDVSKIEILDPCAVVEHKLKTDSKDEEDRVTDSILKNILKPARLKREAMAKYLGLKPETKTTPEDVSKVEIVDPCADVEHELKTDSEVNVLTLGILKNILKPSKLGRKTIGEVTLGIRKNLVNPTRFEREAMAKYLGLKPETKTTPEDVSKVEIVDPCADVEHELKTNSEDEVTHEIVENLKTAKLEREAMAKYLGLKPETKTTPEDVSKVEIVDPCADVEHELKTDLEDEVTREIVENLKTAKLERKTRAKLVNVTPKTKATPEDVSKVEIVDPCADVEHPLKTISEDVITLKALESAKESRAQKDLAEHVHVKHKTKAKAKGLLEGGITLEFLEDTGESAAQKDLLEDVDVKHKIQLKQGSLSEVDTTLGSLEKAAEGGNGGSISQKLLRKGLLTKFMLKQLKKEFESTQRKGLLSKFKEDVQY